jgi:hypothetical protein
MSNLNETHQVLLELSSKNPNQRTQIIDVFTKISESLGYCGIILDEPTAFLQDDTKRLYQIEWALRDTNKSSLEGTLVFGRALPTGLGLSKLRKFWIRSYGKFEKGRITWAWFGNNGFNDHLFFHNSVGSMQLSNYSQNLDGTITYHHESPSRKNPDYFLVNPVSVVEKLLSNR